MKIASTNPAVAWRRHQMETFSAFWSFVREIHRPPVDSPHKGQWDAGDIRRHRAHYDVTGVRFKQ